MGMFGSKKKKDWMTDIGGTPPEQQPAWADGGKFRWTDGLSLALGAIGDGIANSQGREGQAINSLTQRFAQARAMKQAEHKQMLEAQKQQAAFADAYKTFKDAGYGDAEAAALAKGLMNPSDLKATIDKNAAGDMVSVDRFGKPTVVQQNTAPHLMATQNNVYALDPHTGLPMNGPQAQQSQLQSHYTDPETGEQYNLTPGGNPNDPNAWKKIGGAGPSQAPHTFR